jgi:UAA transporter family
LAVPQKSTVPDHLKKAEDEEFVLFYWVLGIALLTAALFVSARMGIYQETLYKRYGKYPDEALFYTVSVAARFPVQIFNLSSPFTAFVTFAVLLDALHQHMGPHENRHGQ